MLNVVLVQKARTNKFKKLPTKHFPCILLIIVENIIAVVEDFVNAATYLHFWRYVCIVLETKNKLIELNE